jgi:excisionase family DNA binding protein
MITPTFLEAGRYIDKKQAATILNCHHDTIQYHIRQGHIPAVKIGGAYIINYNDVINFRLKIGRPKKYVFANVALGSPE